MELAAYAFTFYSFKKSWVVEVSLHIDSFCSLIKEKVNSIQSPIWQVTVLRYMISQCMGKIYILNYIIVSSEDFIFWITEIHFMVVNFLIWSKETISVQECVEVLDFCPNIRKCVLNIQHSERHIHRRSVLTKSQRLSYSRETLLGNLTSARNSYRSLICRRNLIQ